MQQHSSDSSFNSPAFHSSPGNCRTGRVSPSRRLPDSPSTAGRRSPCKPRARPHRIVEGRQPHDAIDKTPRSPIAPSSMPRCTGPHLRGLGVPPSPTAPCAMLGVAFCRLAGGDRKSASTPIPWRSSRSRPAAQYGTLLALCLDRIGQLKFPWSERSGVPGASISSLCISSLGGNHPMSSCLARGHPSSTPPQATLDGGLGRASASCSPGDKEQQRRLPILDARASRPPRKAHPRAPTDGSLWKAAAARAPARRML